MPRTKKKVKSIVKTKVISARVTETVHELLYRQAEDAGMTLSQFAAQMLMKGRVNTSYVFYVHPDEIEAITREFAAIGNNLNQIAAFINSGGIQSRAMHENINHAISCIFEIEDSHAAIVTPEEFEQAQMVIMLQHGKHQAGNYTKHQYPLKGKVYCGYCQKLMKYRVLKKLGPSFNCRFSATAVDSHCKRIPISEELLEEIVRNALTAQIKQAEHVLEILHERERKALICFSALERQEEKLSAEKAELVKLRVALYEQYADGNMSKEEFIRQRDAYRVQEDERMEQIQRLRTEKDQIFQPVKKDTDNLQAMMNTVGEAGDVMHLSQNVVETFIDRIEVFNDERVKIRFTFEDADIKACLNATDWCRADYEYFRGGGYSSHFRCKAEMPVTMLRFNIVEGIGPVLQIAEGWTADLPDEIHNTIDKRTDPTWPTTWFCPRLTGQGAFTDVYSVMANWGANHGVTVYGHVGADLITLASMLRIPVTMHNVPAEKIYRPHAWASFGTQDQQAADYAACKQYGPLYR